MFCVIYFLAQTIIFLRLTKFFFCLNLTTSYLVFMPYFEMAQENLNKAGFPYRHDGNKGRELGGIIANFH